MSENTNLAVDMPAHRSLARFVSAGRAISLLLVVVAVLPQAVRSGGDAGMGVFLGMIGGAVVGSWMLGKNLATSLFRFFFRFKNVSMREMTACLTTCSESCGIKPRILGKFFQQSIHDGSISAELIKIITGDKISEELKIASVRMARKYPSFVTRYMNELNQMQSSSNKRLTKEIQKIIPKTALVAERESELPEALEGPEEAVHKVVEYPKGTDTKKCPRCAETIKLEALVCRYCNHQFSEDEVAEFINQIKEEASAARHRAAEEQRKREEAEAIRRRAEEERRKQADELKANQKKLKKMRLICLLSRFLGVVLFFIGIPSLLFSIVGLFHDLGWGIIFILLTILITILPGMKLFKKAKELSSEITELSTLGLKDTKESIPSPAPTEPKWQPDFPSFAASETRPQPPSAVRRGVRTCTSCNTPNDSDARLSS